MAKAHITTREGIKINILGTPQEVSAIIRDLQKKSQNKENIVKPAARKKSKRILLVDLVDSLIKDGFFKKPKDLAAVKVALEELGHFYPITSLSPTLLRLVRKRQQLRRIKDKKRWLYVGQP